MVNITKRNARGEFLDSPVGHARDGTYVVLVPAPAGAGAGGESALLIVASRHAHEQRAAAPHAQRGLNNIIGSFSLFLFPMAGHYGSTLLRKLYR